VLSAVAFNLRGSDTNLALTGTADIGRRTWDLAARGDASLAILQLFFPGLNSSGAATLNATLSGSFDEPRLSGDATLTNGRLRPLASPHSLEAINGRIVFDENAIRLDGCEVPNGQPAGCLRGRIGTGNVVFGGTISVDGYALSQYDIRAAGRSMRLRYPAGFTSTVNMDLSLVGPVSSPRLTGLIDVLRITFDEGQSDAGLFGLAAAGAGGVGGSGASLAPVTEDGTPLALDIQVSVPRLWFIETPTARIEGTADLQVGGTFDRPAITGTVEILGGEAQFQGNRYFVRRGSIDFINPARFEPVFDVEAETRPRVTGQTYNVTVRISGPLDRISPTFTSDPWLPETDVVTLLLGGTPSVGNAEQRALMSPQESQRLMFQSAAAAILASPISSRIGMVVERTLPIDTVQITPVLANDVAFEQLNPTARITLGKRISPRVFLTYSRTLNAAQEEIILLEYDQSDRISWVLSRNEDRTFALDVRIRFAF
jgi:translocation and assembly module TamB